MAQSTSSNISVKLLLITVICSIAIVFFLNDKPSIKKPTIPEAKTETSIPDDQKTRLESTTQVQLDKIIPEANNRETVVIQNLQKNREQTENSEFHNNTESGILVAAPTENNQTLPMDFSQIPAPLPIGLPEVPEELQQ